MSKDGIQIKIFQTDLGYSITIDGVVPRDERGFEVNFTSLNETLCFIFYDLGREQSFTIIACQGDDSYDDIIDFQADAELEAKLNNSDTKYKNNVLTFKPKEDP